MFKLSFKSFLLPLSLYIFTYLIPQMVLFHSFLDDNIYVTTRKKKARRGGAQSMVTILKREFPDGNFQSLFEGSSRVVGVPSSSSSIAADPLLSSFISAMAADKLFISEASLCGEETGSAKKTSNQSLPERNVEKSLSAEDHREKLKQSEFVQLIFSSMILDDDLRSRGHSFSNGY